MSAALENVPRGDTDVAEVTSFEGAVRAWSELDPQHRGDATLTPERPILMEGAAHASFTGDAIELLADRLPANGRSSPRNREADRRLSGESGGHSLSGGGMRQKTWPQPNDMSSG